MVNNLRMATRVLTLFAVAMIAAGCGGSHDRKKTAGSGAKAAQPQGEAAREAQARKQVPGRRLSPRDRIAYYQIATTSGLLRARAATVLSGLRGTPKATLAAGRDRLALLRPESAALDGLRNRLKSAADAFLAGESPTTASAALKATARINAGLQRYSRGKAVKLLVPD